MAESVAANGYIDVTVADVVRRAGLPTSTFDEHFTDKRACFLDAYDLANSILVADLDVEEGTRFADWLAVYLDTIAGNRVMARVFMVDIGALGPEGFARRDVNQERITDVLATLFGASTEDERFRCRTLVAALAMLTSIRIAADDVTGLRALFTPIVTLAEELMGAER